MNKTKKQLLTALLALSETMDFNKLTVSQLTKKAGVNRQTFYYHFKDKAALLQFAYYQTGMNFLQDEDLSLENWEEAVLKMLQQMQSHRHFYYQTVQAADDILLQTFNQLIQPLFVRLFEEVDQEQDLSDYDKDFYARFLAYGCGGILRDWLLSEATEAPIKIAAQLFRFAKDIEFFAHRLYQP